MPDMIVADSDSTAEVLTDTLYAVTLYGPTSYFIYKGEPMGYDYTLLKEFASDSRQALKLEVATSLSAAVDMLDQGKARLLAYNVPITAHYRDLVLLPTKLSSGPSAQTPRQRKTSSRLSHRATYPSRLSTAT